MGRWNARKAVAALLLAAVVVGCASHDHTAVADQREVGVVTLVRVAPEQGPIDVTMGVDLPGSLAVRVIDARGHARVGALVRFRLVTSGAVLDTMLASDAEGVAALAGFRVPVRDTAYSLTHVSATTTEAPRDTIAFTLRAWRDLSRFGGEGPAVLDRLPVDHTLIESVRPLGTLDEGGDVLPSADAHLIVRQAGPHAVYAMADGLITTIDREQRSLTLRVRDHVRVRVAGVQVDDTLWVGRVVRTGQVVGRIEPSDTLRVRVLDASTSRTRWVRPERYGARGSARFFVAYLPDALRSTTYALVRRAAPDLDGRIDYDRAGFLVGTWFDGAVNDAVTTAARVVTEDDPSLHIAPLSLTFAYDAERPGQVRVAIGDRVGATLGLRGVRAVGWEDPDPARVERASGLVPYHLYAVGDAVRMGRAESVLLVEVLGQDRVRVEVVPSDASTAGFSSRAVILER